MRCFVIFLLFITFFNCFGESLQANSALLDTVKPEEVTTVGQRLREFQSGAKIKQVASAQFEMAQDGNLEQLLSHVFFGNGKFESVTRVYYYKKKNDFKFINPNYLNFENQIFEIEDTQHNAD